jgi:hypothetical protein
MKTHVILAATVTIVLLGPLTASAGNLADYNRETAKAK